MTSEKVKSTLRAYRRQRAQAESLRRTLLHLRAECTAIRSACADAIPSGGGGDSVADAVCRLAEMEERYARQVERMASALEKTEGLISLADGDGATILRERYIIGTRFEDIPEKLCISIPTMWRYYNRSISQICDRLSEVDSE